MFVNCTSVGRTSDSIMAPTKLFTLVGSDRSFLYVVWSGLNWYFWFAPDFNNLFCAQGSLSPDSLLCLWAHVLIHLGSYHNVFVIFP